MNQKKFSQLAKEWFDRASHDIDTASQIYSYKGWNDIICFHCQQAVEKYLKGFLVSQGVNIGKGREFKIHDLVLLLDECIKLENSFKELKIQCQVLTKYYVEMRYPPAPVGDYSRQDSREAIDFTQEVVKFVKNKVK